MSATELARRTGITPTNLSHYETGQSVMGIDKLCIIALVLGVPLQHLQPEFLDNLAEQEADYDKIISMIRRLDPDKRQMVIKMFEAQLDSLLP